MWAFNRKHEIFHVKDLLLNMLYSILTPHRILLIGFISIITLGAFLLTLPNATSSGSPQSFIDALFIATSAVSTTGLSVVDIGNFYSLFGQVVVLILVQIGGLGYMIFVGLVMYTFGLKLPLGGKLMLGESLSSPPYEEVVHFSKIVIFITFAFELAGAAILSIFWTNEYPIKHAIYLGIFHSVSAFCTAGFSLFPDNLCAYRDSILVNATIEILCIGGGLGFFVIYNIYDTFFRKAYEGEPPKRLLAHTKLVLIMFPILLVIGAFFIYLSECFTSETFVKDRILISFFQAVSASTTTGFNTTDTGAMKTTALTMMILLMYIGASPGGTGGGVKTTSFGLLISSVISVISMRDELILFNRHISLKIRDRALAICALALLLITVDVLILSITEHASFLEIVFEAVSAFGTVGLSAGITPSLGFVGKIVIITTMFIGRVGPLAIGYSIRGKCILPPIKYPEGVILVG